MATKIEKARKAYEKTLRSIQQQKAKALKAWSDACIEEIHKITTLGEARAAFKAAPWGTPAKKKILRVWARLCKTQEDFKSAWRVSHRRFKYDNPLVSRWKAVGRKLLQSADTPEKVLEAAHFCSYAEDRYDKDRRNSMTRRAFTKWIGFYGTDQALSDAWEEYRMPFPRDWFIRELDRREEAETGKKMVRRINFIF